LPREFPPWKTVYDWFRKWRIDGTWERLNAELRERLRRRLGRDPKSSAGIVDSQSLKTTGVGGQERGVGAAKKVEGRKRHLLLDTEGLVLKAKVHSARIPDADGIRQGAAGVGAGRALAPFAPVGRRRLPGEGRLWAAEALGLSVKVVRKPKASAGPREGGTAVGHGVGQGGKGG
jgi:putative transposase